MSRSRVRQGLLAILAMLGVVVQAHAADSNPDWLRRPTGEELGRYYPPAARKAGLGGLVMMVCEVTETGPLRKCYAHSERPADLGFGAAALRLAPLFQMRPGRKSGVDVVGKITIPITFKLPPAEPLAGPDPSVEAQALGRKLVDARATNTAVVRGAEIQAAEVAFSTQTGVPEADRAILAAALREAAAAELPTYPDLAANAVARLFTLDELTRIVAALDPMAARALSKGEAYSAAAGRIGRIQAGFDRTVHDRFCRQVACAVDEAAWAADREAARPSLSAPRFAVEPTSRDINAARPPAAARFSLSGRVLVQCLVTPAGALAPCDTLREAPEQAGFGPAALRLAKIYRLDPQQMATEAAAGATLVLDIRFPWALPRAQISSSAPLSVPPERLAVARRLVALEVWDPPAPSPLPDGLQGPARAAAQAAIAAAIDDLQAQYREAWAQAYALLLSEQELAAGLRFRQSPAGAIFNARETRIAAAEQAAYQLFEERRGKRAGALYCQRKGCAQPQTPPRSSP